MSEPGSERHRAAGDQDGRSMYILTTLSKLFFQPSFLRPPGSFAFAPARRVIRSMALTRTLRRPCPALAEMPTYQVSLHEDVKPVTKRGEGCLVNRARVS